MSKSLRDDLLSLLALQAVDSQIEKAKATLAATDNGSAALGVYNTKKKEAEALRTLAIKAQSEQKDTELKLETIETKRKHEEKRLYSGSVTGSRELENLQKELDMLVRQKDAAEENVLLAMDAAAEAVSLAEIAEKEQLLQASRFKKVRAHYEARHKELTAEIESLKSPRIAAVAEVSSAELLTRYENIRGKKQGVGCAPVGSDDSCGACHTRINTQAADAGRRGESIVFCEHCGRILTPAH
ncbi:C4-type zinc ribbon domain-containing protein [Armatimonas sp.]|uniref:zinc ribbon domain-containing protein n=1 Tax=Armatimonas sp. TaxID=1872638 RepID=UPI00286ABBC3|nr:C4-type zinc ribbon domain-containing protein [Armatimonas sp.]